MGRKLAGVVWLALAIGAGAAESVTVTPSAVPGVDLLGPPSAEFTAATDQFFGSSRSANLTNWLPFGVVIANHTSQSIMGVAICWQLTTADGRTLGYHLTYEAFDRPNARLRPGQMGVAVGMTLILNPRRLPAQFRAAAPGSVQTPGSLPNFQSAQSVEATLDGVIYASGQFAGPDTFKTYETYVANTTVPGQVAAKVLAMKAAAQPVAAIVAWLKTAAAQTLNERTDGWWNAIAEKHTARELLQSYQQGGEDQLYQTALESVQKPVIRLYQ